MAREQRPLFSIVLMLAATAAFVVMQIAVKMSRERGMDVLEVMFYRTAPGLPYLWWTLRQRGFGLAPRDPRNVAIRSIFGCFAMGTNFAAVAVLSLAQFSTLSLSNPVFVALVSPRLLGERARAFRWVALPLATTGAFVLLEPGLANRTMPVFPALLGLSSAIFAALAQIWVRKTTASEPAERVVFYFAAVASLVSLGVGFARGGFHAIPSGMSAPLFVALVLGMAAFGTIGQVLMTRAYSHGEATTVAMVGYSSILLSMLADLLLWRVWPAGSAYAGALLMTAAGVVLVRGERNAERLSLASPHPPGRDTA